MTLETANRLYELRKKNNLSQEELAEKLGVSRQAVSKWERSEASPDTDNLIALAKIYGLSLDELIYGEKSEEEQKTSEADEPSRKTAEEQNEESDRTDDRTFFTVNDGKNKVKINPTCIVVDDGDGERVTIGLNGIKIEAQSSEDDDLDKAFIRHNVIVDEDGEINIKVDKTTKFWLEVPYAVICAFAYLIFGFCNLFGGWGQAWIIFITIPIYYSLVEAICKRRFCEFAYPVLTAFIYLYLGIYHGMWHPTWLVFVTIAIYYPIAEAIDKKIKAREKSK